MDYPLISAEDLNRFHDAHNVVGSQCWICGHSEWLLTSTEGRPAVLLSPIDGYAISPVSVVPLICKNCGTVWSISYGALRTWLKENPGSKHDNEP